MREWAVYSPVPVGVEMDADEDLAQNQESEVLRIEKPPRLDITLTEDEAAKLAHIASFNQRGFELTYEQGNTSFLLSAGKGDMQRYRSALEVVYGPLDLRECDKRPEFLRELPALVGLRNTGR
jgi:hypothetical protein